MENTTTQRSQMSVAFRYAIITALVSIVYTLILYVLKLETNSGLQWIGYLILITVMFLGIKDYRDKDLGGFIQYGKALSTGILIAFFAGIIIAIFTFIFYSYIDTNYMDKIIQMTQQKLMEKGMSQDQIDMYISYTKKFSNPPLISFFVVLFYAFFGLIFSLIESAILKKDNPEMPQA